LISYANYVALNDFSVLFSLQIRPIPVPQGSWIFQKLWGALWLAVRGLFSYGFIIWLSAFFI
jgi:hypothetical protein